jgi:NTE family protein
VEIDGVAYWDGGFSANPDLVTLALESPVADTLLVQINPLVKQGVPTGVREIAGYANRLTFNAPLLRDVEIIETVRETMRGPFGVRQGRLRPLATHRFHLVEAGRYTASLSDESKLKPDLGLLTYLHGAGRTQAHKWLEANRAAIGRRSSVDLKARFLAPDAYQKFEDGSDQDSEPDDSEPKRKSG